MGMGEHETMHEVDDEVAEDNGRRMLEECERAGTVTPAAHELRLRLARGSRSAL